jgi:hypothetical protein
MQISQDNLKSLLEHISKTQEVELPCDDVYELIDEFADAAAKGEDMLKLMPLVQQHLEICRDCLEEYEALVRMINAEESLA